MELKFAATARPNKADSNIQRRQKLVRRIDQQIGYLADDEAIIEVEINDFSGGETEEWIALSEDMAEDALNDVRDAWDEDWSEGVTQLGWYHESTEVRFYGELILEPISD